MKIVSYNVNGIRSAIDKGLINFLQKTDADVVCFQETKAEAANIAQHEFSLDLTGFKYRFWNSAVKKGYSGVAIFSKVPPNNVSIGFNNPEYDNEGRIIRVDFDDYSVISVYIPSGSSGEERQAYKMKWLTFFDNYIQILKKEIPKLVICGDYNIVHHPIDIHDPVGNKNSSGFLPEEREWLSQFIAAGFTDSFRHFNQSPHQYSWWSFRAASRTRNKGWRIDYCMNSIELNTHLKGAGILQEEVHSDHCPVYIEFKS